tara:strand:- start:46 stop:354 length:309 start_codon:yes stop_codon:yes gene_type:complete
LKHFTIAYTNEDNEFFEICEYAEKSDEAIKNAMKDIPELKNHQDYIFRCTNESALDWLTKSEYLKTNTFSQKIYINKLKESIKIKNLRIYNLINRLNIFIRK